MKIYGEKMSGGNRDKVKNTPTGKMGGRTLSPVMFFLLFLFLAAAFHGLFFLLFRPLVTNREAENAGRGFTLILTQKNIDALSSGYGLEYWLKYAQSPEELKMQQEASFTARIMHRREHPFSGTQIRKDLAVMKERSAGACKDETDPVKKVVLFSDPAKSLAVQDELFPEKLLEKKSYTQKKFPRWKFNTGKIFYGWHIAGEEAERLLALHKEKVNDSALYRIEFTGKGVPPVCKLIRSCGVVELDMLAKRELLALAGTYSSELHKTRSRMLCTVLWGEELLHRSMKGKADDHNKKGK